MIVNMIVCFQIGISQSFPLRGAFSQINYNLLFHR